MGDRSEAVKPKTVMIPEAGTDEVEFSALIKEGFEELATIHKANKVTDAEIRRLQMSTRKKLDRIRENLRFVQAAR